VIDASEEVGLEINRNCGSVCYHQNAGQVQNINLANRSFINIARLRYMGMIVTNQNLIQKEIKSRLSLANACYHLI
jgi:hypothetical protein